MESGLCKYKDVFGVPGEGFHSTRFLGVAAGDLFATIIAAWVISKVFKWTFLKTFIGLMLITILIHRMFCVNSALNVLIFGKI